MLCPCVNNNGNEDQLSGLKEKWVKPLENAGLAVLLGLGNHDEVHYFPYYPKPVFRYIADRHNATYDLLNTYNSGCYTYYRNGILFLSLGIYPKNISYLRQNLPLNRNVPIIIFYHYNSIEDEPYSDWWKTSEKIAFKESIASYNVLAIINGHCHQTYIKEWLGYKMLNGSGGELLLLEMNDIKLTNIKIIGT
jgi:hypothetical protein